MRFAIIRAGPARPKGAGRAAQDLLSANMNSIITSRDVRTPPAASSLSPAPEAIGAPAAPRPRRILLAEDDAAVRRYLEAALRRSGYFVLAAADGLEAMKLALNEEIDAVVTDCLMPHIGGRELCRFLREHPRLRSLPVLLLSGAETANEADGVADDCLRKPVRPEELARRLSALVRRVN
jgi:CheY-like chemotaxis protein